MRRYVIAVVIWVSVAAFALADERKPTNIPAQDLGPAIQALAQDRHLQISYVPEDIGARRTPGVVGQFTVQGALEQLLVGTGLTYEVLDDKTITIVPITSDLSASSMGEDEETEAMPSAPNSGQGLQPQATTKAAPLPQVTIEAQSEAVRKRITHFVRTLTTQVSSQESVPRWGVKVCPSVVGLPASQREFIFQRVSSIARSAGIPLGGQDCRVNLWIMITIEPARLVQEMRSLNPGRFVGLSGQPATATEIRRFIEDSRPIRAWYSVELVGAMGNELGAYDELSKSDRAPKVNRMPEMSRLKIDDVQTIKSNVVVVDRKRIAGMNLGAVADYVAMVGLAELNLHKDYSGTESILNLFDAHGAAHSVHQLSAWDAAFLKALYSSDQSSISQVNTIVDKMIRDPETMAATVGREHP